MATDAELLAVSGDDPDSFGILYGRHASSVLDYFRRRVDDGQACFDLTAETFAAVYVRRKRFDPDKGAFVQWLYGVAGVELARYRRRQSVEHRALRRLGLRRMPNDLDDTDRIDDQVTALSNQPALQKAMSGLTVPEQRAVELRVVKGLPYAEIGAELGCSTGNARVRVHRGLRKLGTRYRAATDDEGRARTGDDRPTNASEEQWTA